VVPTRLPGRADAPVEPVVAFILKLKEDVVGTVVFEAGADGGGLEAVLLREAVVAEVARLPRIGGRANPGRTLVEPAFVVALAAALAAGAGGG